MAVDGGCEEVEEEGAPQCGDVLVLHLWLNVEPVRLKGVLCARCAASATHPEHAVPKQPYKTPALRTGAAADPRTLHGVRVS